MERLKDYGNKGLIGVLTPQANTTVEPEFWSLLPPGWSMLNARLTSGLDTIEKRLVEYTEKFSSTAEQFANAPIEAITIACTGASYLIGGDKESQILSAMESRYNVPCITAAQAATRALQSMGVNTIAMLTPYPESLNQASTLYWESKGFRVLDKTGPQLEHDAFHPIYAMSDEGVYKAYERLSGSEADAVLMLGTGMATLAALRRGYAAGLLPAISCNLAIVWSAIDAVSESDGAEYTLESWRSGERWSDRLDTIIGRQL